MHSPSSQDDLPLTPDDTGTPRPPLPQGWQPLPARGAKLAAIGGFLGTVISLSIALVVARLALHVRLHGSWLWIGVTGVNVTALLIGWIAYRRHRFTRWRLDEQGFALVQGRLWQSETHIPISRVQHLDVRRGPLERAARLSTLVVHTAGTRLNAVSVSGLDQRDAERLRDRLARQLDRDDDAL